MYNSIIDVYKRQVQVRINGKEKNITADVEKGYLILKRVWENDEVELVFPMKIRKIYANLKVREDAGCVAFMLSLIHI